MTPSSFVMAGGGTGGHVIPALAVARELARRGHRVTFIGTRHGLEAALTAAEGFPIRFVETGALKGVSWRRRLRTLARLPVSTAIAWRQLRRLGPVAVFSTGGYAAGPVVMAAWLGRIPTIVMEANVVPGFTNRVMAARVRKALVSFAETIAFFPPGVAELTGVPVRDKFFRLPPKPREETLTILITGGSQGSRTLNRAVRESWRWFAGGGPPVRLIHQTGRVGCEEIAREFARTGLAGEVTPYISEMPARFAAADLVVSRAGAGAIAELAAAGKPSILVPFPFAADQHQSRNAEAMARAGGAVVVEDHAMSGERLFAEVRKLAEARPRLEGMGAAARRLARPGAATRAADLLEELGREGRKKD